MLSLLLWSVYTKIVRRNIGWQSVSLPEVRAEHEFAGRWYQSATNRIFHQWTKGTTFADVESCAKDNSTVRNVLGIEGRFVLPPVCWIYMWRLREVSPKDEGEVPGTRSRHAGGACARWNSKSPSHTRPSPAPNLPGTRRTVQIILLRLPRVDMQRLHSYRPCTAYLRVCDEICLAVQNSGSTRNEGCTLCAAELTSLSSFQKPQ